MVQGAGSSVGKSLLVAGLCRLYARRGLRVAPFKAQNMSNNAGVTPEGGEIGRAQVTQAEACGIPPHVDMNPVLLKPEADSRSQVVVLGRRLDTLEARDYYRQKAHLWEVATGALGRLREQHDLVIIEGAGSPAELNLRRGDIVNMAIARHADSPVLLAGDIDKGGIFAQLLGTLWLLEPEEQALVKGFIVNKFRGDPGLFTDGVRILEERGGVPVLGVVPWLHDHGIPEEDGAGLDDPGSMPVLGTLTGDVTDIAVVKLPRIANFDDFDPLAAEPGVRVRFVQTPEALGRPAAIILPGTKHTLADLAWLRGTGLADRAHPAGRERDRARRDLRRLSDVGPEYQRSRRRRRRGRSPGPRLAARERGLSRHEGDPAGGCPAVSPSSLACRGGRADGLRDPRGQGRDGRAAAAHPAPRRRDCRRRRQHRGRPDLGHAPARAVP